MAFNPRIGDHSWFAIARQIDNKTPAKEVGEFVDNRFPFTSLGIDLESELQASDAIAGRRSDTKDQQGQLWGSGPIETQLYINKMDEFWRAIINSGDPTQSDLKESLVYESPNYRTMISSTEDPNPFSKIETPGQLEIKLEVTGTGDFPDNLTVNVFGQRRVGLGNEDMLPIQELEIPVTEMPLTTEKYFARVDKIAFNADLTGTFKTTITAKPDMNQKKFVYKNTDDIFPGWTMQLVRGKVPAVAEGAVPVNSTLTISDNIRLSMDILARKLHPFSEIGTIGEVLEIANELKDKDYVDDVFYPNWGGWLKVGEQALIFTNLTLNINQNLDFLPGIKSSRFRLPVVPTGERRNVTLTATVYYEFDESKDKWSQIFQDNAPRQLEAACYYWDENGKEYHQTFKMPVSHLTASPRIGVDGRGPITRELAFKCIPMSDIKPDEIEIEIVPDAPKEKGTEGQTQDQGQGQTPGQ